MRYLLVILILVILLLATLAYGPLFSPDSSPRLIPAANITQTAPESGLQKAVLAGGCFWGVEAVFAHVKGVIDVTSGYSGGDASTATYDQVSAETTGHAESVEITYDPKVISYATLLRVFFSVAHDPTQLNRQGPDVGTSYRSEIFATTDAQLQLAKAYIHQIDQAKVFPKPIVTRVGTLKAFYKAEDYHQDYIEKHPNQPYVVQHDLPKLKALKELFPELYRE